MAKPNCARATRRRLSEVDIQDVLCTQVSMHLVAYAPECIDTFSMALEHALLVSLSEQDASGYDLTRRFDKSIGFFHSATHQQIYRVLKRMDEAGWVEVEAIAQDGRPDKKVYRVSDAGRAELTRWIAEPSEPSHLRNELAVKIRAAAYADLPALRREVARHRDGHAARLDVYRLIEKARLPQSSSSLRIFTASVPRSARRHPRRRRLHRLVPGSSGRIAHWRVRQRLWPTTPPLPASATEGHPQP